MEYPFSIQLQLTGRRADGEVVGIDTQRASINGHLSEILKQVAEASRQPYSSIALYTLNRSEGGLCSASEVKQLRCFPHIGMGDNASMVSQAGDTIQLRQGHSTAADYFTATELIHIAQLVQCAIKARTGDLVTQMLYLREYYFQKGLPPLGAKSVPTATPVYNIE